MIFTTTAANQYGNYGGPAGSQLEYVDFNLVVLGGPTASSVNQLLGVWLLSGYGQSLSAYAAANGYTVASGEPYTTVQNAYGINLDVGLVWDPNLAELEIPGVTTSPGYLNFFMWEGTASSYAEAFDAGDARGTTGVFAQACTMGILPPSTITDMPDVLLDVPEPATFALGLAGLSLLLFRRR